MRLACYTIDAFTDKLFGGNPAAVCPLTEWLPDDLMQSIAAENNLSETAFFVPEGDGYHIRWFTPSCEVELCGHATLASSYVIFNRIAPEKREIRFRALAGELQVSTDGNLISLNFPSRPPTPVPMVPEIVEAIGVTPAEMFQARGYLALLDEQTLQALKPDMAKLSQVDTYALIVTAPGSDCDFVSRFFAPGKGIDEDPVTGSAHCELVPFWAERLGRTKLHARQASKRGGELFCELLGERVKISGRAVPYAESVIFL